MTWETMREFRASIDRRFFFAAYLANLCVCLIASLTDDNDFVCRNKLRKSMALFEIDLTLKMNETQRCPWPPAR